MTNKVLILLFSGLIAASCGISRNAVQTVKVPTKAEADSIMNIPNAAVFVDEKPSGPTIYGFTAHKDSALVSVHTLNYVKKQWAKGPVVTYPCAAEFNLPLTSGPDSIEEKTIAGIRYFTFIISREKDGRVQKTIGLFQPETDSFEGVSFDGKRRRDGKVYGQTDLSMQDNSTRPSKVLADSILRSTPGFVTLSKEQIMSDQAIEWWLEKNPSALTNASQITFGSLPAECTLVQQYSKAAKESGKSFRAALFDTVEYTVIVAQNRATGDHFLAWVEPKCRNSRTDRFLNSIYFANATRLTMFYYKGSRTFKYNLSLASGTLQR